ncbi:MAG: hypothetical protein ACO4CZ_08595 [Planctomycetota bacterium]
MIAALALLTVPFLALEEPPPRPHPGPPVYVEVFVEPERVAVQFTGEQKTLAAWFGLDPEHVFEAPLSTADRDVLSASVAAFLAAHEPVRIDGEAVTARLRIEELAVPPDEVTGYGVPALRFMARCDVPSLPRQVELRWDVWEGLAWFDAVKLPVVFRSFGEATLAFLTPEEPGYTWRPEVVRPPEPGPLAGVAPIRTGGPEPWRVPLVSLGLGLLLLGGWVPLRRAGVGLPVLGVLAVSFVTTGFILRSTAVWTVVPPWSPAISVPAEDAAARIFTDLLRNVYRAFDAPDESSVYDTLRVCVTEELLDQLYGEIYESLILRGEGGAMCQIEAIEFGGGAIDVAASYEPWDVVPEDHEDAPFFRARQSWTVRGRVSHWGHEHSRENAYEAEYIVRNDGDGWRLASCEILDHSRVDRDG